MNQMGHAIPNMIGMRKDTMDKRIRKFLPGYMTMGETGMADMGEMGMKVPRNSTPMVGAHGPFDYITMGGMYTNLQVRPAVLTGSESEPAKTGWYDHPSGTVALPATDAEIQRDLGVSPRA
ncbi:MAG: hypothetical protein RLZZ244_2067 [Verrucomicrobiota bacterium]